MKTLEISGEAREVTGKSANRKIRNTGYIPCELYGPSGNMHFKVFIHDLEPLIYSPEAFKINLSIDGQQFDAILKEAQFHPLSDEIIHVDFQQIPAGSPIKVSLPIRFTGSASGVREGGKFMKKMRKLDVKGLAKDMPDSIELDVSDLALNKSIRVKDIQLPGIEVLNQANLPIASVKIPRLKKEEEVKPAGAVPAAEGAAATTAAPAAPAPETKKE